MDYLARIYTEIVREHFQSGHEMAFIAGPRQVGKTTAARMLTDSSVYFNWDNEEHRRLIMDGPGAVAERIGIREYPVIIFDEIHKFPLWKTFLKGFYDTYAQPASMHVVVTGSARLDIYRKGGDSLMGRYFLYRMHPLSVSELASPLPSRDLLRSPAEISDLEWNSLCRFGGFPQPFLRSNQRFYNKWKRTRRTQVFREDIFDISKVQEVRAVELLAELIAQQAGQLTAYVTLARSVRASQDSIRRWITILENLYYCFAVRPWHSNISRSLRKEPKFYLWDWGIIDDIGARHENMVACHLLKAVHYWTDMGFGDFGLFFLRTKDKREVDFLVTKDNVPWFLVEAKTSDTRLSKNLEYFQKAAGARHAFQVTMDSPFVQADCFSTSYPVKVPARTFLSQLV